MIDKTEKPAQQNVFTSRPYKIALTATLVLLFITVTAAILIIILNSARSETRETEFDLTLTDVNHTIAQMQTAAAVTPTPAPRLTYGIYPFELASGSPKYSAALACDGVYLLGQVVDQEGEPVNGFSVRVWGDYLTPQTALTGEIARQDRGRWALPLVGKVNRRLWAQMWIADRFLSAPVEIVYDAQDCTHNRVEINFRQVLPLD
ncbi:MAG: hypothetical protein HY866_07805 [Chloroflexi bacterium]|nr:hypothetical protein [Chloroflexota bacterium]